MTHNRNKFYNKEKNSLLKSPTNGKILKKFASVTD